MNPNKQQQRKQLRKHLSPAMIVSLIALFFALTGGAVRGAALHHFEPEADQAERAKVSFAGRPAPRGSKVLLARRVTLVLLARRVTMVLLDSEGETGPAGAKGDRVLLAPRVTLVLLARKGETGCGAKGDTGPGQG